MKLCCVTDKGNQRVLNEDFYYIPAGGETFAAVADGMGGHAAGETASLIAVTRLVSVLRKSSDEAPETVMKAAFDAANRAVYREAIKDRQRQGMGTTLTALMFNDGKAILGHVGDSRAYRLRDGSLTQLTTDHSYVEELVKTGAITRQQARVHPKRNLITRCIGIFPDIETDITVTDARESDLWLLCSDGLINYVSDPELESELASDSKSLFEKVNTLKDLALKRGGQDNITVLAIAGGSMNG